MTCMCCVLSYRLKCSSLKSCAIANITSKFHEKCCRSVFEWMEIFCLKNLSSAKSTDVSNANLFNIRRFFFDLSIFEVCYNLHFMNQKFSFHSWLKIKDHFVNRISNLAFFITMKRNSFFVKPSPTTCGRTYFHIICTVYFNLTWRTQMRKLLV